jgi:ketosteroid isomerase-like protein
MDPLSELIDEDIEWNLYGPIDLFPFLGSRRGRPAVVEVCRQLANNVKFYRFDREAIMLGENTAASMMRYSLTVLDTNKPISLRLAHFAQFKNGRLSRLRAVLDSFDLVEQSLGYQIQLPQMAQ